MRGQNPVLQGRAIVRGSVRSPSNPNDGPSDHQPMHTLTPTAPKAARFATPLERLAHWHAQWRHRRVLGVRASAVLEVLLILGALLLVDALWGRGNRFIDLTPHPFWIPVLLAATYYGTREGLFAATMATLAMLYGNFPDQLPKEGGYAWLLRVMLEPLLWLMTAVVLGEIRDAFRRRMAWLRSRMMVAQEQSDALNLACERLTRQKAALEARIADQSVTVHAMYSASRAIERDGVGDVLVGVAQLVRTALNPQKFSMYLLNGTRLEAAISDGWQSRDRFTRVLDPTSPLCRAIVTQRRSLNIVNPVDEPLLRDEGLLAAPIINLDRGEVIGMLKIEAMEFLDLHAATVQNFQVLCDWIGSAITHAQRLESMQQGASPAGNSRVAPAAMLERLLAMTQHTAAQARTPSSMLWLELTLDPSNSATMQAVTRALDRSVPSPLMACATGTLGGFAVLMPGWSLDAARPQAAAVVAALRAALEQDGVHAMVRHRLVPMDDVRQAA